MVRLVKKTLIIASGRQKTTYSIRFCKILTVQKFCHRPCNAQSDNAVIDCSISSILIILPVETGIKLLQHQSRIEYLQHKTLNCDQELIICHNESCNDGRDAARYHYPSGRHRYLAGM